ncbi:MAG: hypothetical protein ACI4M3_09075 [Acutalibacteraceae bacterium]
MKLEELFKNLKSLLIQEPYNDSINLESILKRKYKIYIPIVICLSILSLVLLVVGIIGSVKLGYNEVIDIKGGKQKYTTPLTVIIIAAVFLFITICMAILLFKKMMPIKYFIETHNMEEINSSLNSNFNTDNIYPKMSLYVTDKLFISTEKIMSVRIADVRSVWISARETSTIITGGMIDMVGIRVRMKDGKLVTLYDCKSRMDDEYKATSMWGDVNFRGGLTDEMEQFERKIKREFPDIEVLSDL